MSELGGEESLFVPASAPPSSHLQSRQRPPLVWHSSLVTHSRPQIPSTQTDTGQQSWSTEHRAPMVSFALRVSGKLTWFDVPSEPWLGLRFTFTSVSVQDHKIQTENTTNERCFDDANIDHRSSQTDRCSQPLSGKITEG